MQVEGAKLVPKICVVQTGVVREYRECMLQQFQMLKTLMSKYFDVHELNQLINLSKVLLYVEVPHPLAATTSK